MKLQIIKKNILNKLKKNNLKIGVRLLVIFISMTIFVSCFDSKINNKSESVSNTNANNLIYSSYSKLEIDFPEKPEVNTIEHGQIEFNSDLDTFNISNNIIREKILYIGKFNKRYSLEELKKKKLDSFILINQKKPVYFKMIFNKEGEFYLGGYLKDNVILKNYYNDGVDQKRSIEIEINKKVTAVKKYVERETKNNRFRILLRFPDTLMIQNKHYGQIVYKSDLDTIELNENNKRATVFHVGKFKNTRDIVQLEGKTTDTFRIRDDRKYIPFGITFDKEGEFILDGFVEDIVLLKNYNKSGVARVITKLHKISKKVTVVKE